MSDDAESPLHWAITWSQAQNRGERNIYRYCGCGHKKIRHERGMGRCLIHNPSCACEEFRDIEEKDMSPQITKTTTVSISSSGPFTIGDLQSFLDQVPRPQGLDTHVTVEYADPGEFVLSVTV